jgi:hypothetical protein
MRVTTNGQETLALFQTEDQALGRLAVSGSPSDAGRQLKIS